MATRDFLIRILGDAKGLDAAVEGAEKRIGALGGRLRGALGGLVAGFSVKAIVDASDTAARKLRELDTVLESTGNTTGLTRQELIDLSAELQKATTFGDEALQGAEAVLARFGSVSGDIYRRALQATTDLATRNGDLEGSALKVGRALEMPLQGIGALAEAGVTFTAQQQAQVKALVESGRTFDAQQILLAGLERSYAGTAKAATETFGGAITQLQNAFGDLLENPGGLEDNIEGIQQITELLQDPATVAAANVLTGALFDGFNLAGRAIQNAAGALGGLTGDLQDAVGTAGAEFKDFVESTSIELEAFGDVARIVFDTLRAGFGSVEVVAADLNLLGATLRANALLGLSEDANREIDKFSAEREETLKRSNARYAELLTEGSFAETRQRIREVEEARAARQFVGPPIPEALAGTRAGTRKASTAAADPLAPDPAAAARAAAAARTAYATLRATIEQQLAQLRTRTTAELTDLDRRLNESSISFANAAAARVAAQRALIDAEIAGLQQQLAGAGSPAERIALETRITTLYAERERVALDATRAQADAQRGLDSTLQDLSRDLQRATGDSLRAELADIEDRYRDTLQRLKIEGNAAGVSLIEQLIGAEQDQARLAEFERRVAELQTANAARQQSIANQRTAGVISERRAAQELIDANLETADSLRAVVEEYRALAVAAGDTAALARIEEITGAIITLEDTTSQAARSMAQSLRSGLEDVFKTAITDIRDLDSALASFFSNIASQLAAQAGQNIVSGLFGEEGGEGDLLEKLGSLLTGDFSALTGSGGSTGPSATSPLAGVSYASPLPVTLVGPGGIGGGLFGGESGQPAGEGGLFGAGGIGGSLFDGSFLGSSPVADPASGGGLLGSSGIGGSLFGGAGSDPAALADTIGGDLVAAFDAASAAGAGLADVGLQWGGQGIDFAGGLAEKLTGGTGPAFSEASTLASSFFSSQVAGIGSTTAASTAAAATTTATATSSNAAIAASAAPAAALTSIASFGGAAIAAAIAIPLVTAAIGALLTGAFATGGIIDGDGTGTSDSNLALVSDGEAIIPARVVNALGEPFFEDLIDGRLPAFADGGVIDLGMSPRIAGGGLQRLSDESIARTAQAEGPAEFGSNSSRASGPEIRINNIVDPSTVRNFLTSPDGSRVIINVIRDNPGLFPGGSRR